MELIHALNRGVDGRDIFLNDKDRLRFIHNLYEFNDTSPANPNSGYFFKSMDLRGPYLEYGRGRKREQLVDIHGWVLMNNHYHLLLSERVEGGITGFLRKLNVGYAKYFNEKQKRSGTLFQGRTKKILIEHDAHFLYILHYIHLNPLDYLEDAADWRIRNGMRISNATEVRTYLTSYRWSSFLDYAGTRNFPSILTTTLFQGALIDPIKALDEYLSDAEHDTDTDDYKKLCLE